MHRVTSTGSQLLPNINNLLLVQQRSTNKSNPWFRHVIKQKIDVSLQSMNSKLDKVQQLISDDSIGGWEKCWEQGLTPWDLGGPTPVLLDLIQRDHLPKGRVLVPGCGSGYDVVVLAGPERYVVGVDVSENAIKKARELLSSSPKANYCALLEEDFFSWFFCAIEPSMRSAWTRRVQDFLKPDGELITLMFPISDHIGGPPYKDP